MSRGASTAFLTALQSQVTRPVIFFEGVFGAGTLRLWSGLGSIIWGGQTWTGAGTLLSLSEIDEPTDIVAAGFTVSLSGIPTDLVSAVIADVMQGDQGRILIGLLDDAGALIVDPVLAASGRMDVPTITDDAETCVIDVSYEGRLIDLNRPREWRYTHESQQQVYPGDRGFEYVAALQDKEIIWGQASPVGAAISPRPKVTAAPAAKVPNNNSGGRNPHADGSGGFGTVKVNPHGVQRKSHSQTIAERNHNNPQGR
jgi:hypothetical protein